MMKPVTTLLSRATISAVVAGIFAALCGCGDSNVVSPPAGTGPGAGGSRGLKTSGAISVYVIQQPSSGTASILQFSATSNGSSSPSSTLTLPPTFLATALATDSSGQIYVGGDLIGLPEVLVYAAGASGTATVARTIVSGLDFNIPAPSITFGTPSSMTVDSTGNLYVMSNGVGIVTEYSPTASGTAVPLRILQGTLTQIGITPVGIATGKAGNLYVATYSLTVPGQIVVFDSTANGNVPPARVIAGSNTGLNTLYGMDTDASGNLYVITLSQDATTVGTIEEFGPAATGNATPIRIISGSNTGMVLIAGLHVDAVGNIYFSGTSSPTSSEPHIAAFSSTDTGNISPAISFNSTTWTQASSFQFGLK
jgi:hypothetical protein